MTLFMHSQQRIIKVYITYILNHSVHNMY